MTTSKSYDECKARRHRTITHSPDGVNHIVECVECCKAWQVMAFTGEVTRLARSTYERRLIDQKSAAQERG